MRYINLHFTYLLTYLLPPEIDHLTKIDKNNKFKMVAAAILDFCTNSNNSAAD